RTVLVAHGEVRRARAPLNADAVEEAPVVLDLHEEETPLARSHLPGTCLPGAGLAVDTISDVGNVRACPPDQPVGLPHLREPLHPVAVQIGDVDLPLRRDRDAVRDVELPVCGSRDAPARE